MPSPGAPRVIATDFDGTLLRSDLTLSDRTRRVLAAAEQAGLVVVVVTARPPRWMDAYADAIGEHGIVLCGNGAFSYEVAARRVTEVNAIPAGVIATVAARLRGAVPGIVLAVEAADGMVREEAFAAEPRLAGVERAEIGVVTRIEESTVACGKLLARCPGMPTEEFFAACAQAAADDVLLAYSGAADLAEMTAPGVTKASALQRFCDERGIDAADVWAFGDMPNDIPMLRWAGRGYAVAGGHPEAVAAATHRCPGNDEDGVASVIEDLLGRP